MTVRTLFRNAQCWSAGEEIFDGILIEGGIITAIGEDALASKYGAVIDLEGAFLSPAFIDGHAHPIFAGREAAGPKISGLLTLENIVAAVHEFATANPDEPWIIGGAYEAALIEGGDFDAHWLDAVVSDRPVVLHAVDLHTIWVNSKALEIAGITGESKDPEGGRISRRADGTPQGTLREPAAISLILDKAPSHSIQNDVAAIARACAAYLDAGVTAAIDSWVEKDMALAYLEAAKNGALRIAMNLSFLAAPTSWRTNIEEFNRFRKEFEALPDATLVMANSIKFLADGALSVGTALLIEPYLDSPKSSGIKIWEDDELLQALLAFDRLKYQVHIHAIGDAAVRQGLDAIEEMIRVNPAWDRRPVIVHAQLISDEDLPRFRELGVITNIQPLWTYLDPMNKELILPRIGQSRNDRQYRLRSMLNNGAMIAFGSDWPVTSQEPLRALAVPVHRDNPDLPTGHGWNIAESITVDESLTFYTANVAYQLFRENERGSLEIGKAADFVVLDRNPLNIAPEEVASITIKAVYQKGIRVR